MPTEEPNQRSAAKEPLPKAYDPLAIEEKWARKWVDEKLFEVPTPAPGDGKNPFTILLPPPNVTGRLHMGHMFEQTETDILIRWRRMSGDRAMWVPGTDHAGIATQMLVERQLATENLSREGLGRDAFIERVWQWKQLYGSAITDQMKRLGASVDWQREYFTMDERLSVAVREAFVRLHEQGLIYRGAYIVNWCPRCQTALSDLEVVHEEHAGKLWHIRYATADGADSIVIATTRPETMLGDVAVAVNPNDERYRALHGKMLRLPLLGREIPLVLDDWANPEFGTGAVKVTPAHDPNDFAIGQRHNLPSINVMDVRGIINENGGPYAGLDRYAARKKILADLEEQGILVAAKDHTYALGRCDRCKTVVEPRLSTQWFLAVDKVADGPHAPTDRKTLKDRAKEAVDKNYVKIGPEQHRKVYLDWMANLHDWCISRQLWWGHRIPAWHCAACGKMTVAREAPQACAHCGAANLQQETDVLDTWFSSGLLPFTVFGWPGKVEVGATGFSPVKGSSDEEGALAPEVPVDLAAFYPTQLLVTGFDILFFWVARMIMLGTHFMLDMPMTDGQPRGLKDAVPFREVHIHALVRDADRQKMSKTKGNVIDPIEIITRYGTDAVRFTLASMASPGTDIAFSEARTEGYRAFANKIWNAARFIFMQRDRAREHGVEVGISSTFPEHENESLGGPSAFQLEDRWIDLRLKRAAVHVNAHLENYRFDLAAATAYQFFWNDFCDWYVEIVKFRLDYGDENKKLIAKQSLRTLLTAFDYALRLLSPFMPFITEELWFHLYGEAPPETIARSKFPVYLDTRGRLEINQVTLEMALLQAVVTEVRTKRKFLGVPDREVISAKIRPSVGLSPYMRPDTITDFDCMVRQLAKLGTVEVGIVSNTSGDNWDISLLYEKPTDTAAEHARLTKDLAQQEKEFANNQRQLGNESFLAKAPAHVVEGLRKREAELTALLEKNRAALAMLEK